MILSVSLEYGERISLGFLLCLRTASALIDARGERSDSRLSVTVRIEESSPLPHEYLILRPLISHDNFVPGGINPDGRNPEKEWLKKIRSDTRDGNTQV